MTRSHACGALLALIWVLSFASDAKAQQTAKGTAPTFDCSKVTTPLPITLCSHESAAKADWELSSAFWALVANLDDQQKAVREQDGWFKSLTQSCSLATISASPSTRPSSNQINCVVKAYRDRAASYRARLSGEALAEATMPPDRHKQVQEALIGLGLLKGKAEGVFGRLTRSAIKSFQANNQFAQTGFLSPDQRLLLFRQSKKLDADTKAGEPTALKPAGERPPTLPASQPPASEVRSPAAASVGGRAICGNPKAPEAVATCTKLIGAEKLTTRDLVGLIMDRGLAYEEQQLLDAALNEYRRVLVLDSKHKAANEATLRVQNRLKAKGTVVSPNDNPQAQSAGAGPAQFAPAWLHSIADKLSLTRLALAVGALLIIAFAASFWFRRDRNSASNGQPLVSFRMTTRAASLVFGAGLGIGLLIYLIAGGARSVAAVPGVSQHVPLGAQAYAIIPNLPKFIASTKTLLLNSANTIDPLRFSRAISGSPAAVREQLFRFQSTQKITIRNQDRTVPNGCRDLADFSDLESIGLRESSAAAIFVDRNSSGAPTFVLGPLDKRKFASFLSNSTSRYLLDLSVDDSAKGRNAVIKIDKWASETFQLCQAGRSIRRLAAGTFLNVGAEDTHTFLTLDPVLLPDMTASFDIECSYQVGGESARSCHCEVLEIRDAASGIVSLGGCRDIGKRIGQVMLKKPDLYRTFLEGGELLDAATLDFPIVGRMTLPASTQLRWNDDTVVIGATETLSTSPVGTKGATRASVVRDDSFIRLSQRGSTEEGAFFGAFRPDFFSSGSFFNRLVSLPIGFVGLVKPSSFSLQTAINFEPLDATVLRDMSRDGSSAAGEVPISTSVGSASLRIGDDKIRQYVRFADQFIFDRLIEGLGVFDTSDPAANLNTNFVRYLLRKIEMSTEASLGTEQSFATQPHQIIIVDDPPDAWAPSLAAAIKFETVDTAKTFVCGEPQALRQSMDRRILLNLARAAKAELPIADDLDSYRDRINEYIKSKMPKTDWDWFQGRYTFDPHLMVIAASGNTTGSPCTPRAPAIKVGDQSYDVYYLSPPGSELAKRYYFRIPELLAASLRDVAEIDRSIKAENEAIAGNIGRLATLRKLKDSVSRLSRQIQGLASSATVSADIKQDALQLMTTLKDLEVVGDAVERTTLAELQSDFTDGSVLTDIDQKIDELQGQNKIKNDTIASYAIQRAQTQQKTKRISDAVLSNNQRMVALIDERRRLLFIANNWDVLQRAVSRALPVSPQVTVTGAPTKERVRFFASGDSTIQSALAIDPLRKLFGNQDLSESWRAGMNAGQLLPVDAISLGLSGQRSGIVLSLNLNRKEQ